MSVHPAIGTTGPSSRSIFNASARDFGCSSIRFDIDPSIRLLHSQKYHFETYVVSGFSRTVTVRLKADTTYEAYVGDRGRAVSCVACFACFRVFRGDEPEALRIDR